MIPLKQQLKLKLSLISYQNEVLTQEENCAKVYLEEQELIDELEISKVNKYF